MRLGGEYGSELMGRKRKRVRRRRRRWMGEGRGGKGREGVRRGDRSSAR